MSLANLLESTPAFYVGLARDGSVVKVYNTFEKTLDETDTRIISIGVLSTMVTDYDEVYSIGEGLAETFEAEESD